MENRYVIRDVTEIDYVIMYVTMIVKFLLLNKNNRKQTTNAIGTNVSYYMSLHCVDC